MSDVKFGWIYLGRLLEGGGDPPVKYSWKIRYEGHKGAKGTVCGLSHPEYFEEEDTITDEDSGKI